MNAAPQYLGRAGDVLARKRLTQYRRYAELVASQEAALHTEDMELFEAVSREISDLQLEIGSMDAVEDSGHVEAEVSEEAAAVLQEALEAVERIRARLSSMRNEGAQNIKNVKQRRPQGRRYVAEGTEAPGPSSKLDFTL